MSYVRGLKCIRCGKEFLISPMIEGCPECAKLGKPSNLTILYDYETIKNKLDRDELLSRPPDMWRYHELLPVDFENRVSLQEGNTPLLPSGRLGEKLGIKNLYFKDESRNPTWSFKDRLGAVVVSKAFEFGARVITDSSTGNQGAASAAHAAKAGLPAVIFTHQYSPPSMHILMRVFGAHLVITKEPADRSVLMKYGVNNFGWFPTCNISNPPVGSSSWGIEGYKTIAYEICQQFSWKMPEVVFFPTDFGDGVTAMFKAFNEFISLGFVTGKAPRMYSIERFGALKNALDKGLDYIENVPSGPSIALSIATGMSTYQALHTLRISGGGALMVEDEQILEAQIALATQESIFTEPSSAAAYAGLVQALNSGLVHKDETMVLVLTSGGLKTPEIPIQTIGLRDIPHLGPDTETMLSFLKDTYRFDPASHDWKVD